MRRIPPENSLDLTRETRGEVVEFLEKVEASWKWPQQACTTMFFLIPKNVLSERPIVLMPTLIRWWEALRAPDVAKWQQKYRIDWDGTDGRNGGTPCTVWEVLVKVERFKYQAREEDHGPAAMVLDLAKAFERVSLLAVSAWSAHCSFPGKMLRVHCAYFEHQRRVQFQGCVAEPLQTITAILPGSTWSWLLLRIVLQDALSEVTTIYPPLKLRVFVDDITAILIGRNKEVAELARKGDEEVERRSREKGLKLSVTENCEGKKEQDGSVVWLL